MKREADKKNGGARLSLLDLNNKKLVWINEGKKSVAYFCKKQPIRIDRRVILGLKKIVKTIGDRSLRLCLHNGHNAPVQEMVILARKGKYHRPHKHLTKGETFHIIEGKMGVFSFLGNGNLADRCILEPRNNFMYKVKANMYHAIMPISDLAVFLETRPGPFAAAGDSIYPSWAPDGDNPKDVDEYLAYLKKALRT